MHLSQNSDAEWADALAQNEHVRTLRLDSFPLLQQGTYDALQQVIATRANLEKVSFYDHGSSYPDRLRLQPEVTNAFLQAIQQNPAIQVVEMHRLRLCPTSIASFLDAATSIKTFGLTGYCNNMVASDTEQGANELIAASIERNENIRKLILNNSCDILSIPFLQGLVSNSHLKELVFAPRNQILSPAANEALGRLLQSTTSIERLELCACNFSDETIFHPIARSIIHSDSITDVELNRCKFQSPQSKALFEGILQTKLNLRSLSIVSCGFGSSALSAEVFLKLLRTTPSLRSFELENYNSACFFKDLFVAVEQSPLESFSIGDMREEDEVQALVASIPKMRVKMLKFTLDDGCRHLKPDLLDAIKKNTSLVTTVEAQWIWEDNEGIGIGYQVGDLFDANDKVELQRYASRNASLLLPNDEE